LVNAIAACGDFWGHGYALCKSIRMEANMQFALHGWLLRV
jgi:hypothetical protein